MSEAQMTALLNWLNDASGRVKMVVTSVPFFPDLKSESDDKWSGFVPERTKILDFILSNKIAKVVFLSGDVHCSFNAELTSVKDPAFKVISIVFFLFFWPYPHMDAGEFGFEVQLYHYSKNLYMLVNPSAVFSTDNCARVKVNRNGMTISFFKRKGELLSTVERVF